MREGNGEVWLTCLVGLIPNPFPRLLPFRRQTVVPSAIASGTTAEYQTFDVSVHASKFRLVPKFQRYGQYMSISEVGTMLCVYLYSCSCFLVILRLDILHLVHLVLLCSTVVELVLYCVISLHQFFYAALSPSEKNLCILILNHNGVYISGQRGNLFFVS